MAGQRILTRALAGLGWAIGLGLVGWFAWCAPVKAVTATDDILPPVIYTASPTGVNVSDGTFTFSRTDLSIGTLSLERFYSYTWLPPAVSRDPDAMFYGPHESNNFDIFVAVAFVSLGCADSCSGYYTPVVHIGKASSGMYEQDGVGMGVNENSQDSSKGVLSYNNGTYVYIDHDGAVYTFNPLVPARNFFDYSPLTLSQRIASIAYPDGRVRSFSYDSSGHLKLVEDTTGYAIVFDWAGTVIVDACGFSLANDRVDITTTCAGADASLEVRYGYTRQSTVDVLSDVTDVLGRAETYATTTPPNNDYGVVGCIKPPGYASCKISNSYGAGLNQVLAQVLADGSKWGYVWTLNNNYRSSEYVPVSDRDNPVSMSDGNGQQWHFVFTGNTPVSATDPLGNTTNYTYVGAPNWYHLNPPITWGTDLAQIAQPEGDQYNIQNHGPYVSRSSDSHQSKPHSPPVTITYNFNYTAGNCINNNPTPGCTEPTAKIDATGAQTDYVYDARGNLISETGPARPNGGVRPQTRYTYGWITTYALNSSGILAPFGSVSRLRVISACATTSSCAGTADETRTTISYAGSNDGQPTSMTRSAGHGPLTATTSTTYDPYGNAVTKTDATSAVTRYIYDLKRRVIGEIGPNLSPHNRAVRTTYDQAGRATLVETGYTVSQSDADWADFQPLRREAIVYDGLDRKIEAIVSYGATTYRVTQTSYDGLGHVVCVAERMNPAAFNNLPADACTLGPTGPDGPDRITQNSYDAEGRLTTVVEAVGTPMKRTQSTRTYTPNGKVQTLADANGNLTTYVQDGLDRPWRTQYPTAANGSVSNPNDYEQLDYDADSRVIQDRRRDGRLVDMIVYDALGDVVSRTLPIPTDYGWDNFGRLTVASRGDQALSYVYDALGRETSESGAYGVFSFDYDLEDRLTGITWPDGFYVLYPRDAAGEVTQIEENGAMMGPGVLATYAYDDLGRRVGMTRGNGVSTTWRYDGADDLTQISHAFPSGQTAANEMIDLGYDAVGEIVTRTSSNPAYDGPAAPSGSMGYGINGLNQVTGAGSLGFSYDLLGNLVSDGLWWGYGGLR